MLTRAERFLAVICETFQDAPFAAQPRPRQQAHRSSMQTCVYASPSIYTKKVSTLSALAACCGITPWWDDIMASRVLRCRRLSRVMCGVCVR